jgi:hypothetical protein
MPIPDFAHGIQISFLDTANRARIKGASGSVATAAGASGANASAANGAAASGTQTASGSSLPLSFDDVVDMVNPLQHLPIVSTLYRHYANDPINTFPKIAGDTLYGGPLGLITSVADTAFQKITGKSFGDTMLAWVTGDDVAGPAKAVASAATGAALAVASSAAKSGSAAIVKVASTSPPAPPAAMSMARPATNLASATGTGFASGAPRSLSKPASSLGSNLDPASFNALSAFLHDKGMDGDTGQRTLDAYRRTMELGTELPPGPISIH